MGSSAFCDGLTYLINKIIMAIMGKNIVWIFVCYQNRIDRNRQGTDRRVTL